jgi:DNA-binding NarL/FixJ family response regulator
VTRAGPSHAPVALLVEDEPEAREHLARALRKAGLDTVAVADAEAAIEALRARPVDVAILDLVLGEDDRGGLSVLTAMRAMGSRGLAVVITAFADVVRLKKALNLGASYLLEKPFRAAELVALVHKLLAERDDLGGLVSTALARAGLTDRETQVALLVLKGLPSAEIAAVLGGSDKTVRQHLSSIYEKCGVASRPEFFHHVFPF